MSFDYDPQDAAHISGADFMQMCDEMKQLRGELLAAQAVIEQMRETLWFLRDAATDTDLAACVKALELQPSTEALCDRDRKRDAALLRALVGERCGPGDAAEFERIAKLRLSGEWEPELEVK